MHIHTFHFVQMYLEDAPFHDHISPEHTHNTRDCNPRWIHFLTCLSGPLDFTVELLHISATVSAAAAVTQQHISRTVTMSMFFALLFPLLLRASATALLLDPEHCRVSPAGTDNVQCHWPSSSTEKMKGMKRILRESDLSSPSSPSSSSSTYLMFGLKVGSNKISGGGYNFMFAVGLN